MRLHILGIAGTFMGGLALLARQLGHQVTGSDANIYPPMSEMLAAEGIPVGPDTDTGFLQDAPDLVVIGNARSRGQPLVEAVLERGLAYTSGPDWLARAVCPGRRVLAVAGTHGKTTTTGMLAWILERAGRDPGFLVGGVPGNFAVSARLGGGRDFVIEADEYDTAFFDKRSKFIHYRPRIAVLNNLEFDHADIFDDLEAIRRQFHHLVRTVPGNGKLVVNQEDAQLREVLERGCWTPVDGFGDEATGAGWQLRASCPDFSEFQVRRDGVPCGDARIPLPGRHNAMNALAAIAAAAAAGVAPGQALEALADFIPPKRRLELRGETGGVSVYDDFAHHPTAIRATLEACRARYPGERLVAVLEPRSNTMRMGRHRAELASALAAADRVLLLEPAGLGWSLAEVARELGTHAAVLRSTEEIVADLTASSQPGDRVIVMSNGSFDGLHARLLSALEQRADS